MIIVLRYNILVPTVIYELNGRSRITTGLLHSIFGLRVPDDGTVTFYREIKLKMGFGVERKIRTRLDLLSIPQSGGKNVKTFRWDNRLQTLHGI